MRKPRGHVRPHGAGYEIADLDFTTRGMYQGYIERTIRPVLGEYDVHHVEQHPELLDKLYARLRKCRRLCGGRRGLIDHRPAGRGKRLPDGTPDHECDSRCRPHECKGAEPATIAQIHANVGRIWAVATAAGAAR